MGAAPEGEGSGAFVELFDDCKALGNIVCTHPSLSFFFRYNHECLMIGKAGMVLTTHNGRQGKEGSVLRREERRLAEAHLKDVFVGPAVPGDYPAVERHCIPRPRPSPGPSPGERGVVGVVVKGAQVRV